MTGVAEVAYLFRIVRIIKVLRYCGPSTQRANIASSGSILSTCRQSKFPTLPRTPAGR